MPQLYNSNPIPASKFEMPKWHNEEQLTVSGSECSHYVKITIGDKSASVDARSLASAMAAINPNLGIVVVPKLQGVGK